MTSVPSGMSELRINEVPAYLERRYKLAVTRQTVYNWMNHGRNGETLKYAATQAPAGSKFSTIRLTTTEWVDDFLARSGMLSSTSIDRVPGAGSAEDGRG